MEIRRYSVITAQYSMSCIGRFWLGSRVRDYVRLEQGCACGVCVWGVDDSEMGAGLSYPYDSIKSDQKEGGEEETEDREVSFETCRPHRTAAPAGPERILIRGRGRCTAYYTTVARSYHGI